MRDLVPISLIAAAPLVLTVHPSVPVKSTKDLIAFAKAHPGKLNYAKLPTGDVLEAVFTREPGLRYL